MNELTIKLAAGEDMPHGSILIDDELIAATICPTCGARLAFKRNTPEGWLTFCINGCNGRTLVIEQAALVGREET